MSAKGWIVYAIVYCMQIKSAYCICGYESCHPVRNGYVNVHIIPHSHDDLGWTKTVDQYYADPSGLDVRAILSSSYNALRANHNRRFIYAESAFFFRWWNEQDDSTKLRYKELVNNGQLEFVSGGWSMNDEATTSYQSIIDQFTLGLRKLNETFGKCGRPKVGWQIDPFGHSSEMASILAQIGFDGLFLGRIDYQDKDLRMRTKSPEMIWRTSKSLGVKSEIFTSVLYNGYFAPDGFSWDMWSGNPDLNDYNLRYKWKELATYLDQQVLSYKTRNIILTMGGDFNYMNAEIYFSNLDRLIRYANLEASDNSKYHLLYSTPSCYLKAVNNEAVELKIQWPIKIDDFFPYADAQHAYWTGYFTSRPTLKYFERLGNNLLQVCKQLSVLADLDANESEKNLNSLKEIMGVMQHHDAVSGTEQAHVANDYSKMLSSSMEKCGLVSSSALRNLVQKIQHPTFQHIEFKSCLLTNISQCEYSEKSTNFVITVYNPLSRAIDLHLRIPVTYDNYTVKHPFGNYILTQLVPIPKQVLGIPGRRSEATHELVFKVTEIPPFGFRSYYINKGDRVDSFNYPVTSNRRLYKRKLNIRIGRRHGLLKKLVIDGKKIPIRQEFMYYTGAKDYPYRASGAYVFRPESDKARRVTETAEYELHSGPVVNEVHQTFNNWISQVVRLYHDTNHVELNWLVGPLPEDGIGREVISRFNTPFQTNATFFTDSNCREMQQRVRNFRPTWDLNVTEPISGNYYPVTSSIRIKDVKTKLEVSVLTDRSQGGTSSHDGEIELMVHRNTVLDDKLGVVEPLNERAFGKPLVVRGTHWVMAGYGDEVVELQKDLAEKRLLSAWTFLTSTKLSYSDYKVLFNMEYSGLAINLPKNVKILTMEPLYELRDAILLRLEHTYEVEEHPILSKPIQIPLKDLFEAFSLVSVRETTLAGNQWMKENAKLKYPWQWNSVYEDRPPTAENNFTVDLSPMQIRTFIVVIQRKPPV